MRSGFVFKLYKLTHNAEPVVRLLVLPPVEGRWPISREALYVSSSATVDAKKIIGGVRGGAGGELRRRRERRGGKFI